MPTLLPCAKAIVSGHAVIPPRQIGGQGFDGIHPSSQRVFERSLSEDTLGRARQKDHSKAAAACFLQRYAKDAAIAALRRFSAERAQALG